MVSGNMVRLWIVTVISYYYLVLLSILLVDGGLVMVRYSERLQHENKRK